MRWRLSVVIFACTLVGIAGAGGWYASRQRLRAPIDLGTPGRQSQAFDFGEAWVGQTIHHVFKVTNSTDKVLHLSGVHKSCSCTVTKHRFDVIQPHETVEVPVEVKLGDANPRFASDVVLLFSDRDAVALHVQGQIIGQVPRSLAFGEVLRGKPVTQSFDVMGSSDERAVLSDVQYDQRYIDVQASPSAANSRDVTVIVKTKSEAPFGPFEDSLSFRTNEKESLLKRVMVSGTVLRPLEVRPARLTILLDKAHARDAANTELEIYSPYGRPVHLDSAQALPPKMLSLGTPLAGGANLKLPIRIVAPDEMQKGVTRGVIKLIASVDGNVYPFDIEFYVWRPQ